MKKSTQLCAICMVIIFALAQVHTISAQVITTNKDKVLAIAVRGKVAPAEPSRSYAITWNGKPKMAIGVGGIPTLGLGVGVGNLAFRRDEGQRIIGRRLAVL